MTPFRSRLGVLGQPDYQKLFASTTVTRIGQSVTAIALPLVAVLTLDATEFEIGLLFTLSTIGWLLVGLPAGAWVDRLRRRPVLIATDLLRALVLATIPLAWWAGLLTLGQLYTAALINSLLIVFFDVAYQSYLPSLVDRGQLVSANSAQEAVRSTISVGGPGAAGYLIQLLTAPVAILANSITLALSAVFVARIRKPEPPPAAGPGGRLLGQIRDGLSFVLRHQLLRPIAINSLLFNLGWSAYTAMLLVYLARNLGMTGGMIGIVFACGGIGGVLGAVLIRRVGARIGQGRVLWLAPAFISPSLLLVLLAVHGGGIWIAAASQLLAATGIVSYNVTQVSFRQAVTPHQLLGRMTATMRVIAWGAAPLGALAGGILGQWLGVRPTLLIGAVSAGFAFAPTFFSPLRNMLRLPDSPTEVAPTRANPAATDPEPDAEPDPQRAGR